MMHRVKIADVTVTAEHDKRVTSEMSKPGQPDAAEFVETPRLKLSVNHISGASVGAEPVSPPYMETGNRIKTEPLRRRFLLSQGKSN